MKRARWRVLDIKKVVLWTDE